MKAAYFGIDPLRGCLELLEKRGWEIAAVFTIEDDDYDHSVEICQFAQARRIPLHTRRATPEDIRELERAGVTLSVTAGYPWKIPLSELIMQVNLHPAFLPRGRGAWPMPVSILKNIPSGVTLHKLAAELDKGDILLQQEIPLEAGENLVSLSGKIAEIAPKLLDRFLDHPEECWKKGIRQTEGEYWPEPGDRDRFISPIDTLEQADRILRAFLGYGSLGEYRGVPILIQEGCCVPPGESCPPDCLKLELAEGVLAVTKWQPYFREIKLEDRDAMEAIRSSHPSALSDFTFPLLYCWREALGLRVLLGKNYFIIRSREGYFCPVGDEAGFLPALELLLRKEKQLTLRFCDSAYAGKIQALFPGSLATPCRDDEDYLMDNRLLDTLEGGALSKRRNDLHHYSSLQPPPETQVLTAENLHHARAVAEQCREADFGPQEQALDRFEALGLRGILVKRGQRYVGFAIASQKEEDVMQGHFSKTLETERGASLYTVRACSVQQPERYRYTNLEDDMGEEGLRCFKQSLHPERIPSFTITIKEAPLY